MTPELLATRLEALAGALLGELRTELETVANDGQDGVIQRITETGKDAKGASFKPYTDRYLDYKSGVTTKKSAKGKAGQREKAKAATPTRVVGKYKGFVDFTLTTRMLTNIGIVENADQRVVVGGRSAETKKKMEGNDKHRPGWFSLSKQEVATLKEQSAVRVGAIITRFLNQ